MGSKERGILRHIQKDPHVYDRTYRHDINRKTLPLRDPGEQHACARSRAQATKILDSCYVNVPYNSAAFFFPPPQRIPRGEKGAARNER